MTYEDILTYVHSYQFKLYSLDGDDFESRFVDYTRKHGALNRKELRRKYRRADPVQLIGRLLDLTAIFYDYTVASHYLESEQVRYFKLNFWVILLWTFECTVEYECQTDPYRVIKLLDAKKADYGNRNFDIYKDLGILTRIIDKLSRLDSLLGKKQKPNFESIQDTYMDAFNYCLLALKLLEFKK